MININNIELKRYFKQIKTLLPIYSAREKKYIKDLQLSIENYIEKNPDCTMDDIFEHFDTPTEIVYDYISSLDTEQLCKKLNIRKWLKRLITTIILAALLLTAWRTILLYRGYEYFKSQTITHETIVIE